MKRVFAETAKLEMTVETTAISFPPLTVGVDEITRVLVRDFDQINENVYSFCLTNPPSSSVDTFACRWIVGMSDKAIGAIRIGCGHYDWSFQIGGVSGRKTRNCHQDDAGTSVRMSSPRHGLAISTTLSVVPALRSRQGNAGHSRYGGHSEVH
jgi:hypothetical protein